MNTIKASVLRSSGLYDVIACEICFSEIPLSEAKSGEATEYVVHFCGLECYEKWKNQYEKE